MNHAKDSYDCQLYNSSFSPQSNSKDHPFRHDHLCYLL